MALPDSPYSPNIGNSIPLATAAQWTKKYQEKHPQFDENGVSQEPTYATFFGRKTLKKFMKRWGKRCVGIRIYEGINDTDLSVTNRRRVVLVAVDKHGNDLVEPIADKNGVVDDPVLDNGTTCPTSCTTNSPLMQ